MQTKLPQRTLTTECTGNIIPFPLSQNTSEKLAAFPKSTIKGDKEMQIIVTERKDGRYETKINKREGGRKSIYGHSPKDCKDKALRYMQGEDIRKNANTKPSASLTVSETLDNWYCLYKEPNLKESSRRNLKMHIATIKKYIGKLIFSKVTSDDLQKMFNKIPMSRTRELILQVVKSIWKFVCGNTKYNPSLTVQIRKAETEPRFPFNLTQQKAILKASAKTPLKDLVLFYLITGARLSEALTIKPEYLDIKEHTLYINGTKRTSSKRKIKITPQFAQWIKKRFTNQKYLFNFQPSYVAHHFHAILKELNIKGCVHCLRHTAATNMYYLGMKDKDIQYTLGHAKISLTLDIYTHCSFTLTPKQILGLYPNMYPCNIKLTTKLTTKKLNKST